MAIYLFVAIIRSYVNNCGQISYASTVYKKKLLNEIMLILTVQFVENYR